MKPFLNFVYLFVTLFILNGCLSSQSDLNLNFEKVDPEQNRPVDFEYLGDEYAITADLSSREGRYSLKMQNANDGIDNMSYASVSRSIPIGMNGREIRLCGFIKTENILKGKARIWMRIDGSNKTLYFDNMEKDGVTGTTDWDRYCITLPLTSEATNTTIGCLMNGQGIAWFDNLSVYIDDKNIETGESYFKTESNNRFSNDQVSSNNIDGLDEKQIQNLFTLCRIWGFLKYYHPNVADGSLNWDQELFERISTFTAFKDSEALDSEINSWLDKLGEFKVLKGNHRLAVMQIFHNYNWDWFHKLNLRSKTIQRLEDIKKSESKDSRYYVDITLAGNPIFTNEDKYENMNLPDIRFQFLSLCRYWNYIEYFYPYKYLMDKNMESLFRDNFVSVVLADSKLDYHLAILKLVAQISDGHAIIYRDPYIESFRGRMASCAKVEFIENSFTVTNFYNDSLAALDQFKIGDRIVKIKGRDIDQIIKERSEYTPNPNKDFMLRNIGLDLLRDSSSTLDVSVIRNMDTISLKVRLYEPRLWKKVELFSSSFPSNEAYKFVTDEIGYINLSKIKRDEVGATFKLFENTKGVIIDNRGYPRDFPIYEIGNHLAETETPFAGFTYTDKSKPGDFYVSGATAMLKGGKLPVYRNKIAILVDANTLSSSEFHTMAFRKSKGAITIGTTTAGSDGNISEVYLPDGILTYISGIGVYHPDLTDTQRGRHCPGYCC